MGGVDDAGRQVVSGNPVRRGRVQQQQVGGTSRREDTAFGESQRRCRGLCRHAEELRARQDFRGEQRAFPVQPHEAQDLQHVEVAVRGGAVGRQSQAHPPREHLRQRRHFHPELLVSLGSVGDVNALRGEERLILRGGGVAVRYQGGARQIEQSQSGDVGRRRETVTFQGAAHLLAGFAQVEVRAHPQALRLGDTAPQHVGRRHVGGVRSQRRVDASPGRAVPRLDEGHRVLEGDAADLLVIADAKVTPREQGLHPALGDDLRDPVHPEVVIGETDAAAADHLGGSERRPPGDVLGFERRFRDPDLLVEPALEGQILRPTALQRHRRVAVRVEEGRQRHQLASVNHLIGREIRRRLPYREDALIFQRELHARQDAVFRVERERRDVLD